MQHLPTFASSIHSLFITPIEIMKLKQIFALLGVALLGLSACSKDTPKTNPASSGSLAGSQWEYIEQELEDDGKTEDHHDSPSLH